MIDEASGLDFPIFQRQLYDLFGDPEDGSVEADYIRIIDLGDFKGDFPHMLDYEGNPWDFRVYGNYVLKDPLRRAFQNLLVSGCAAELKSFDGCFNVRRMRGSGSLSVHSWGLAVDFNAASNPFGGPVRFSDEFIKCFADAGFEPGALWSKPDGMHFQLCWLRDWTLPQYDGELKPIPWVA